MANFQHKHADKIVSGCTLFDSRGNTTRNMIAFISCCSNQGVQASAAIINFADIFAKAICQSKKFTHPHSLISYFKAVFTLANCQHKNACKIDSGCTLFDCCGNTTRNMIAFISCCSNQGVQASTATIDVASIFVTTIFQFKYGLQTRYR